MRLTISQKEQEQMEQNSLVIFYRFGREPLFDFAKKYDPRITNRTSDIVRMQCFIPEKNFIDLINIQTMRVYKATVKKLIYDKSPKNKLASENIMWTIFISTDNMKSTKLIYTFDKLQKRSK